MIQDKFSAPPQKARQLILMNKIEEARKLVIEADIELSFLTNLKNKIDKGKLSFDDNILKTLNDNIEAYSNNHDYYLEKLNFLKEMRELRRADKVAKYIENTTPDKVSF